MNEVHEINQDAWSEWCEYRKLELRKKIGPIAARKQKAFLMGYPPPIQQTIIDQSIMNSWQGLFPPKNQPSRQLAAPGSTRHTALIDDLTDTSWAL